MSNYTELADKIKACKHKVDFVRADKAVTRLYNAGQISGSEAYRLFTQIMVAECGLRT